MRDKMANAQTRYVAPMGPGARVPSTVSNVAPPTGSIIYGKNTLETTDESATCDIVVVTVFVFHSTPQCPSVKERQQFII